MNIKDNKIMLLEEDLECVHLYLDDKEIKRQDSKGNTYSIVERIKWLEERLIKKYSDLETHYLAALEALSKMKGEAEKVTAKECYLAILQAGEWKDTSLEALSENAHNAAKAFNENPE